MTVAAQRPAPTVQYDASGRRLYTPDGRELTRFLFDNSEIAVIRGPYGSGKTAAACQRIFRHLVEQNYSSEGGKQKRKSRWIVMRDSYPRLETTTMATWTEWFPPEVYGKLYTGSRPFLHEIRIGDIHADIWFAATDELQSDAMFKSLEPTGLYHNELEFTPMGVFFSAHGRVGRYPRALDGGSKWSGSIADTNAPPESHWLPKLTGEVDLPDDMSFDERMTYEKPPGMAYFVQPPALFEVKDANGRVVDWRVNPAAENIRYLADYNSFDPEEIPGERYYQRARRSKPLRWVQANLCNKIVAAVEGDPVFPTFDETIHVAKEELKPVRGLDVIVGLDFGRKPAAVFGQKVNGQMQVQFDAAMENAGASRFAPVVREMLARHYPFANEGSVRFWGDPKGDDGTQTDDRTAYDVFQGLGMRVRGAPVKQNNINTRIEAVEIGLDRLVNGRPALILSPKATRARLALAGGYHYAKERPAQLSERKPVKNRHCVPMRTEALTPEGWAIADELGPGDPIIACNEKGELVVSRVTAVNLFPGPTEVVRLSNGDTRFEATENHQHVVRLRSGMIRREPLSEIMNGHSFITAAAEARPPKQRPFSGEFISIAAWVMAEGSYRRSTDAIILAQSESHNPAYCEHIDLILKVFQGALERPARYRKGMRTWYIRRELALLLRQMMPGKCPSPRFIMMMSNSDRRRFLFEFMRGDGCWRRGHNIMVKPEMPKSFARMRDVFGGYHSIEGFQKRRDCAEALQMIGTLAGVPVRLSKGPRGGTIVRICSKRLNIEAWHMEREVIETDGVWCPTTTHGTWVCRLDGQTFVTGNSDIADALQYLQLGEGAGREMVGNGRDRPRPVSTWPGGQRRTYRRI